MSHRIVVRSKHCWGSLCPVVQNSLPTGSWLRCAAACCLPASDVTITSNRPLIKTTAHFSVLPEPQIGNLSELCFFSFTQECSWNRNKVLFYTAQQHNPVVLSFQTASLFGILEIWMMLMVNLILSYLNSNVATGC